MPKNILRKFAVSILGIVVLLLVLEACLRIVGIVSLGRHNKQPAADRDGSSYIILCLGDSFTYGAGSPYGMDYPSQLERILNSWSAKKKFKVINRGAGSYNTFMILNKFEDTLRTGITPDLVVFLGGSANNWNYIGYHTYLKENTLSAILKDYLYRIRIYKLAKLLSLNVREKIKDKLVTRNISNYLADNAGDDNNNSVNNKQNISGNPMAKGEFYKQQHQYDERIELLKRNIETNPMDTGFYVDIGRAYREQLQYDEAIQWLKRGLEINPEDVRCYREMGRIYSKQRQYDEAIRWLKRSIEADPSNSGPYVEMGRVYSAQLQYDEAIKWLERALEIDPAESSCYVQIAKCYEERGDYEKALKYLRKGTVIDQTNMHLYFGLCRIYMKSGRYKDMIETLNGLAKDKCLPQDLIDTLNKMDDNKHDFTKGVKKWIISDVEKIIKICKENGIKVLLIDYPDDPQITDLLSKTAKVNSVPFVNNYEAFHNLRENGESMKDYLAPDRHCNARGYGLMANNIFAKMIQEKMLNE